MAEIEMYRSFLRQMATSMIQKKGFESTTSIAAWQAAYHVLLKNIEPKGLTMQDIMLSKSQLQIVKQAIAEESHFINGITA